MCGDIWLLQAAWPQCSQSDIFSPGDNIPAWSVSEAGSKENKKEGETCLHSSSIISKSEQDKEHA